MNACCPPAHDLAALQQRIEAVLDPKWLAPPYDAQWTPDNPTYGFCSLAAEAAWFVLGGKQTGWVAHAAREEDGSTHWWLEHASGVRFDPTAAQYRRVGEVPPYERGVRSIPCGFMGIRVDPGSAWGCERRPSRRAQALLTAMGWGPEAAPACAAVRRRSRPG